MSQLERPRVLVVVRYSNLLIVGDHVVMDRKDGLRV